MKKGHIFLLLLFVMIVNTLISIIINDKANNTTNDSGFFTTSTQQRNEDNSSLTTSRKNSITEAVRLIEPAVVSINVIKTQVVRNNNFFGDPFFGFFNMPPMKQQVQSIGSGVIINKQGYIATNGHVVDGATQIKVVLADGREFDAKVIGIDDNRDVAVIQIKGDQLPYAVIGSSDDLIVGEWAIAVGNPYGYLMGDAKPSVSVGVISAYNRNFGGRQNGTVYKGMIQTDAAINPGNSGGPLVNIYGEVIGLNTFIFSESGGSVGIGFAIPIDRVKKVVTALIDNGKIKDVNFGFKVQDINPGLASALNVTEKEGVVVAQMDSKGPAVDAGLKLKDVIISINGYRTKNTNDIQLAISDIFPGDNIVIKIDRKGKEITLNMKAEPL
jgi:serine protease Do